MTARRGALATARPDRGEDRVGAGTEVRCKGAARAVRSQRLAVFLACLAASNLAPSTLASCGAGAPSGSAGAVVSPEADTGTGASTRGRPRAEPAEGSAERRAPHPRPEPSWTIGDVGAGDSRSPTAREARAMEALFGTVERLRGLRFRAPVTTRVEDERAIRRALEDNMDEDELERGRCIYVALGLLPADVDVRALLLGVLGEQVVGYYDHRRARLVVREDALAALVDARMGRGHGRGRAGLAEGEMVLVHELVHALQDQALGLGRVADALRTSDASTAFHSLVEGDATLAMVGYLAESAGQRLEDLAPHAAALRRTVAAAPPGTGQGQLERAPAIVREPMLAAYLDGMVFVAHLFTRGGWTAVDRAHLRRPPASMEQVLHPERYERGEPPEPTRLEAWLGAPGPSAALAESGLREEASDTLGELDLKIYFAQALPQPEAAGAADGWAGDAVRAYQRVDGLYAAVWATTWDDEAQAAEAARAFERVALALPPDERAEAHVARAGRAVLALRRIPQEVHATLVDAHARWAAALPPRWPPGAR